MPVNWAFPAAQGEPESFLGIQGPIHRLRNFLLTAKFLAAQFFVLQSFNRSFVQRARRNFLIAR